MVFEATVQLPASLSHVADSLRLPEVTTLRTGQHCAFWTTLEHDVPFQREGLRTELTQLSIILFLKCGFLQRARGFQS